MTAQAPFSMMIRQSFTSLIFTTALPSRFTFMESMRFVIRPVIAARLLAFWVIFSRAPDNTALGELIT